MKRAVANPNTNDVEKLLKKIPEKFFLENFRLDKDVFQINSNDQAMQMNENLSKYLEIIEANLVKNIS